MIEFIKLAELRKPPTPNHQDLRGWRFRDKWLQNDTTTVLAWSEDHSCVFHEDTCPYAGDGEPTAKGRIDEVRDLFDIEQPKGTFRYFGFCGHCLAERIPNYGWEPTPRDLQLLENLQQRLEDINNRDEQPIKVDVMIGRMKLHGSVDISLAELKRLMQFYKQTLGDEEVDLSDLVRLSLRR